jgi:hypothetical protein
MQNLGGKVYTSPELASQYNQMSAWNRRLGKSFGMKETFELKILCRATAATPPGKSLRGLDQETRGYTNPVPEEVRS